MTDLIDVGDLIAWLHRFRDVIAENRTYLTELDSAIGDADHGTNMARGMDAVVAKLDPAPATVADLFKKVGMTLVTSVGGASGPLYGTFFLRMGAAVGSDTQLDGQELAGALRAGLDGIVARGKAEAGDKTMYDALQPAMDALDWALDGDASLAVALRQSAAAAAKGRDATIPLVARKGRASYLGERSAGHLDPGATSATLLMQALADQVAGQD
ncbi:dihydroxyacetone kinase subunit DhaL [Microbacterium terrisoli]|jgi:dihydroxyacetone kinase-like protein|uniref:dihydroxyacetone kinase subunit DhaL n=1 Tax=Microbacterium terrisoli TaxID=3242192 RepID=UPI0028059A34|nr:dihydroxyacetone kinase subunit DhaL [Microbacterium protaetiae]